MTGRLLYDGSLMSRSYAESILTTESPARRVITVAQYPLAYRWEPGPQLLEGNPDFRKAGGADAGKPGYTYLDHDMGIPVRVMEERGRKGFVEEWQILVNDNGQASLHADDAETRAKLRADGITLLEPLI